MINKHKIESIEQNVDLVALARSRGIALKKNGNGCKATVHSMKTVKPHHYSHSIKKTLAMSWLRQGGGDVIEFVKFHMKMVLNL